MFVAFGRLVLCCLLVCTSAFGEPAPSAPTPTYSSSLHSVIATAPVRIRMPEEERSHRLDDALHPSIVGYRTLDYFSTRCATRNPSFLRGSDEP
jgi:hypothetical protein